MTDQGAAPPTSQRIEALAETAAAWRDPEHLPRREAARQTLDAPNRFTEEALAFAVNHAMHRCTAERLSGWAQPTQQPLTVGVLHDGAVPLGGFRWMLAVLLSGHRYVGAVAESDSHLLPAFVNDLSQQAPELPARFVSEDAVYEQADALIAPEQQEDVAARCEASGIPPPRRRLRAAHWSVAVLDGSESEDEREGLAEDAWLHDGHGVASVRLVWAPGGLSPDPYLEAMAQFRGVFPAHEDLPGALAMQRAMLEARDQAHAYADGLVFLMSKGKSEAPPPGHLRWAEYDDLAQVERWLQEHAGEVYQLMVRRQLADQLSLRPPVAPLGTAHRAALGDGPLDADLMRFLRALGVHER